MELSVAISIYLESILQSSQTTDHLLGSWIAENSPQPDEIYSMDLIYRPGRDKNNPADYITRHPYEIIRWDNAGEVYIANVAENAIPKSLTLKEVQSATRNDQQLQRVCRLHKHAIEWIQKQKISANLMESS